MDFEAERNSAQVAGGRMSEAQQNDSPRTSYLRIQRTFLMKFLQSPLPFLLLFLCLLTPQQVTAESEQQQRNHLSTTSELNLERQALSQVPVKQLCQANSIATNSINLLSLADNQISLLEDDQFACVSRTLRLLILTGNQISSINEEAFRGLNWLQVLRLDHNQLTAIPAAALTRLHALRHLNLAYNRLEVLEVVAFERLSGSSLISLDLKGNPLVRIASIALIHLTRLQTLSLSGIGTAVGKLSTIEHHSEEGHFEPLEGLGELRFLHLDRMQLNFVPRNLCSFSRKLSSLVLKSNKLQQIPKFAPNCLVLLLLDLSYNQLSGPLERANLSSSPALLDLYLGHNKLTWIHENAFSALTQLQVLELNDNLLAQIHPLAFLPVRNSIKHLDLARNKELTLLSGIGLEQLISFRAVGNEQLRRLPQLSSARTLSLTYAYHCCEYTPTSQGGSAQTDATEAGRERSLLSRFLELLSTINRQAQEQVTTPQVAGAAAADYDYDRHRQPPLVNASQLSEKLLIWPQQQQASLTEASSLLWINSSSIQEARGQLKYLPIYLADQPGEVTPVRCSPAPGPFQPCRALFDNWWLRASICCVFLLAFTGNLLVIIVLGSAKRSNMASSALTSIMWPPGHSKRHIDVPRFLVLNLAVADLMMSFYLAILTAVDLGTLGEFRLFAIEWQQSRACKLAGFLAILSSELSVFILAIITLERNYAITNAVHLNRRLSLQKATFIVLLGYSLSLTMAILPLQGQVSDYGRYAICLPLEMDSDNLGSQLYAASLISVNTLSFILLLGCYLRMYCAIRGSQAWNANDLRIARRMSILVLTDFLCWIPIICVAIGSLAGYQPVGPLGLKLIIIFVLPLNSVANPFLYAITTKKFKRDLDSLTRQLAALTKLGSPADATGAHAISKSNGVRDPNQFYSNNYRRHTCKASSSAALAAPTKHFDSLTRGQLAKGASKRPSPLVMANPTCTCQQARKYHHLQLADQQQQQQLGKHHNDQPNDLFPITSRKSKRPKIVLESDTNSTERKENRYKRCTIIRERELPAASSSVLTLEQPLMSSSKKTFSHLAFSQTSSCQALSIPKNFTPSAPNRSKRLNSPSSDLQIRSVSACGSSTANQVTSAKQTGPPEISNSYETVSATGSALNWLLVYGPIAKAWSSIQISFSSASQLNNNLGSKGLLNQTAANGTNGTIPARQASNNSAYFTPSTCQEDKPQMVPLINSTTYGNHHLHHLYTNEPSFFPVSPVIKQRPLGNFSERRMSRSLDLFPQQVFEVPLVSSSSTDISESQAELLASQQDDDQHILLLAKNRRILSGKGACENLFTERKPCQRCRSWSPALLSKLEGCISQIKSRIPRFAGTPRIVHNKEQDLDPKKASCCLTDREEGLSSSEVTSSSDEFQNVSETTTSCTAERLKDIINLHDQSENNMREQQFSLDDKFDEEMDVVNPCDWTRRRSSDRYPFRNKYQTGKRLSKQHSSTNSDTISTRTAGTLLTNMSVSSDSSTSIPPPPPPLPRT